MDFSTLKTRCATRFRDPGNAIVDATGWGNYLNDALADVESASERWPWRESRATNVTLSAGTSTAAIPGSGWHVFSVLDATHDYALKPIYKWTTPDQMFPTEGDDTGDPIYYRAFGQNIEVFPVPSSTVTLHVTHIKAPTELVNAGDVPPFGSEFHRIVLHGALASAYLDDGNTDQYQVHAAIFAGLLAQMKATYLRNRTEGFVVLGDDWDTV